MGEAPAVDEEVGRLAVVVGEEEVVLGGEVSPGVAHGAEAAEGLGRKAEEDLPDHIDGKVGHHRLLLGHGCWWTTPVERARNDLFDSAKEEKDASGNN